ncbi:Glyoxalase/Bleomycin resistance protein/Dihydroxybiphenyl dioxygenase [Exophiala viscosa]|uniref:Glyoxalase/Bleomycin resistance protein/Dihydroxybiphenyl dioxygenase n=1 Tax=Exophiala viscosa TaxID=2486360 RepID=A0AAN6DTV8_9EURO|nr:Glyoxalase/Bleomycin resistance protein/Dihydroxybiphenyl dioxygenase [Exophiala viscosa]
MVAIKLLVSCLALAAQGVHSCALESRQTSADFLTIGDDGPADPETLGFAINHLSLIVRNLTASQHFYSKVLGMRHIFTAQLSPSYSVTYMGHAQGGRNGTGYQTGQEMLRDKNNAAGLLELQYLSDSQDEGMTATTVRPNTFSHIGLIVPDLEKAQARMEKFGAKITKRIGQSAENITSVENALGFGPSATTNQTERKLLVKGQQLVGFAQLLTVEDPDGNMIEVQQHVPPPGVA